MSQTVIYFQVTFCPKGFCAMKKQLMLPLAAAAGGAAALVLRLLQNKTGFEASTGLPIPGNAPGIALAALLAVLAVALCLLTRLLPPEDEGGPFFPEDFRTVNAGLAALPVAGVFLMAVSGALDIAAGAALLNPAESAALAGVGGADGPSVIWAAGVISASGLTFTPRARALAGALTLIAAVSLLPAVACCRRRPGVRPRTASPALLLVPPVCMVARLVLAYRVDSVNPALQAYYVEILALTFMTLAFYRLSSLAYHAVKRRRFAPYAGAAAALCLTALADSEGLSALLLYAGGAATLLGFLLLWLTEGQSVSEIVENDG